MATVTSSIISAGGGDYTTIAAWLTGTDLNSGADIWKGEISDNSAYDESVSFTTNGTSTTSYVWLTTATANRHAGVAGTGHGRISYSGAATYAINFDADYARVSDLEIYRPGSGSIGNGDHGIEVDDAHLSLVDKCIIWTDEATAGTLDGIMTNSTFDNSPDKDFIMDNCAIYGWTRSGIAWRYIRSGGIIYIDHCTIVYNGDGGISHSPNNYTANIYAGDLIGVNHLYNNLISTMIDGANDVWDHELANVPNTGGTLNGSNNGRTDSTETENGQWSTDNSTGWVDSANGVSDSTAAAAYIVNDFTGTTTFDLTPVDHANNDMLDAGTNRQGSEPDARQDFSVDLAGNARPTTGITLGAIQLQSSGAAAALHYWKTMAVRNNAA